MKYKIWLGMGIIFCVLSMPVFAEDLTGKWIAEMQFPNGEKMQITFSFQQDGEKLSGTVGGPMGEMPIFDGIVKDKEFSFAVKMEREGNAMKMLHKGKIDGDAVIISLVPPESAQTPPEGAPKMEMKAKRAQEKIDISGQWTAEWERQGGEKVKSVFAFKQDGEKLTGTVTSPRGEREIADGKISGKEFSFIIKIDMNGEERKIEYKGVTEGNVLKITMTFPERPSRELIAKKESPEETAKVKEPEKPNLPSNPLPAVKDLPDNGLVRTPPMGWNSWNNFAGRIDDKSVREIADAMVESGMKQAGYQYIVIDDTWEGKRDQDGNLLTNEKFPDMKALADYVHSKGLKFGIYSSPGPKTCARYEGSYAHEEQDAKTFAAWGVDYIKYDWCSAGEIYDEKDMRAVYQKMAESLRATGRPIVYSLCQYGKLNVWEWGKDVGGNLWRITGDIRDDWYSMTDIGFNQADIDKWAGPGHWNDPDMLEIGNGGMNSTEYKTHMSLWCILAAPLMAGNDLRSMSKDTLEILTNPGAIAINQDELGKQGKRVVKNDDTEVWSKPLRDGRLAVGLFNRGRLSAKITAKWADLGLNSQMKVKDVWENKDLGIIKDEFSSVVPWHGVSLVIMEPKNE